MGRPYTVSQIHTKLKKTGVAFAWSWESDGFLNCWACFGSLDCVTCGWYLCEERCMSLAKFVFALLFLFGTLV